MDPTIKVTAADVDFTEIEIETSEKPTSRSPNSGVPFKKQDCNFSKLLSKLPKSKCSQFVTQPTFGQELLLVNENISVLQLEGQSAKLSDIKSPNKGDTNHRPIFRIIPNSHMHIINHIVVSNEDCIRKINENDPAIMQKLRQLQHVSAAKLLKKLKGIGEESAMPTSSEPCASSLASKTSTITCNRTPFNVAAATTVPLSNIQPAAVSVHPDSVITNVRRTDNKAAVTTATAPHVGSGMPLITPVPLVKLPNIPPSAVAPVFVQPVADPDMEKM